MESVPYGDRLIRTLATMALNSAKPKKKKDEPEVGGRMSLKVSFRRKLSRNVGEGLDGDLHTCFRACRRKAGRVSGVSREF